MIQISQNSITCILSVTAEVISNEVIILLMKSNITAVVQNLSVYHYSSFTGIAVVFENYIELHRMMWISSVRNLSKNKTYK